MIRRLQLTRFKSVRELSLECSRVNVFVGPPDSGKTNILEALYFLSRLGWALPIDSSLRLRSELGFDALFFRQFFDEPIRIQLSLDPAMPFGAEVSLALNIAGSDRQLRMQWPNRFESYISFGQVYHLPDLEWVRYYSFGSSQEWAYRSTFQRGTEVVTPPNGVNLTYIARHNSRAYDFLKDVVGGLGWKLKFDQTLKTFLMSDVRDEEILDYNLDLLSDSLKRLFFYTAIIRTSENATLVFDEPDVFAFPPYPKTLGDLIAVDPRNQYFLTTHNPYFLGALVEKTAANELAVFVCSRDDEGGTVVRRVPSERMSLIVEHGASVFFNLDELTEQ